MKKKKKEKKAFRGSAQEYSNRRFDDQKRNYFLGNYARQIGRQISSYFTNTTDYYYYHELDA